MCKYFIDFFHRPSNIPQIYSISFRRQPLWWYSWRKATSLIYWVNYYIYFSQSSLIMVDSKEELKSLQSYVYKLWLEEGGTDEMFRLWTNAREPIEYTNKWFWDDDHKFREYFARGCQSRHMDGCLWLIVHFITHLIPLIHCSDLKMSAGIWVFPNGIL